MSLTSENVPSDMCTQQRVRPGPSLGAFWILKDAKFLHTVNENSDRVRRLIRVDVGRTCLKVRFSHVTVLILYILNHFTEEFSKGAAHRKMCFASEQPVQGFRCLFSGFLVNIEYNDV